MVQITYVEHDGTEHVVDSQTGVSLMQAAIDNLVPGIDADCGGECSCATCHVMVNENWVEKVGSPGEMEESMLFINPEWQENSRLSCQVEVSEDLDGLRVTMPEFQF